MPKQTLQGFLYSSKSICGIQNTPNFPFWQLSCISRFKLLGFRRNTCSPAPLLSQQATNSPQPLFQTLGVGWGAGRGEEMASHFLQGISSYFLMFFIGAEFLQVYKFFSFFFLSFLPSAFLFLSLSLPPCLFPPCLLQQQTSLQAPNRIKQLFQGGQPSFHCATRSSTNGILWFLHTWGPGGDASKEADRRDGVMDHWPTSENSFQICSFSSNSLGVFSPWAVSKVTTGCYSIRGGLLFLFLSSGVQAERKLESFLQTTFGPSVFLKAMWTKEVVGNHSPL